ncbi:HIT family protein [Alloscardovia theropitheci]|uniref:HIT family protein n=1 Tax=Alloscardovia theropitheci TaxID=2496842 RepID=A0A4R0QSQ1_9BIFI|nr:HIT family protein [Alloscardovia theropitheci]TCD54185.1 HIT family protein [Alloscardovia theropitheci]
MTCNICKRIELIKQSNNPFFVRELETGYVVLGDSQYFYGYTLFLAKEHIQELHQFDRETKLKFLEEMSLVQEAVAFAFHSEKMNIEMLGNGDVHMHWHIFPRRHGDLHGHGYRGRGPVWWVPWEEMNDESNSLSDAELKEAKARLDKWIGRVLENNALQK